MVGYDNALVRQIASKIDNLRLFEKQPHKHFKHPINRLFFTRYLKFFLFLHNYALFNAYLSPSFDDKHKVVYVLPAINFVQFDVGIFFSGKLA